MENHEGQFREIFDRSPTGILFYDKEGRLINANQSALKIAENSSLDICIGANLFDNLHVASRKEKLLKNGLIRFKDSLNFDNTKEISIQTKSETVFIGCTVSVTASGFLMEIKDITEYLKTKKALIKSETRFHSLYENSFDAILLTKPDGSILAANPAAEKMFDMSEEEIIMAGRKGIVVDERVKRFVKERAENGKVQIELTHKRKDGSVFPAEVTSNLFTDVDGTVKASTIIRDITKRKKLEEDLRQAKDYFEEQVQERTKELNITIDSIADGVVICNRKGDIVQINDVARMYYENIRLSSKDNLKERVEKYRWFYSDGTPVTAENVPIFRALQGEVIKDVDLYLNNSEGFKWLTASAVPLYDKTGSLFGGVLTFNDTTERKVGEEKLKETLNELSDLYNNAPCGYHSLDGDGYFVQINDTELNWLGYSREEIIGKKKFTDIITEESVNVFEKNFPGFKERGDVYELKFDMVRKNGSVLPVLLSATSLRDSSGKYVMSRSTLFDITEREKSEKELKILLNELKRSNEELQQFAYVSSHDLQEPLRTIASFTQLLERRYKGKLDEDADEFIDYIVDAAIRMKQQIEDLLEYSRVTTSGAKFKHINTDSILNEAISNLKNSIDENNAKIIRDPLPDVIADEDQLIRVFQNLISNAIKYRKPDEPPRVHISAYKESNEYVFSVQDNGIGIGKQYLERIFRIFQRLHTIDEYQGTGIGLSVVKRVIDRHGGRIWVESELGEGSVFYFTVPIKN